MSESRATGLSRLASVACGPLTGVVVAASPQPGLSVAPDAAGLIGVYHTSGHIDSTNPFFQSLGTNGRRPPVC